MWSEISLNIKIFKKLRKIPFEIVSTIVSKRNSRLSRDHGNIGLMKFMDTANWIDTLFPQVARIKRGLIYGGWSYKVVGEGISWGSSELHISAKNLLRTLIRRKPRDIAYRRKVIAPLNEIQCTQRCAKRLWKA